VVIGASTGGPHALFEILPHLPRNLPACIIVVQHMPAYFTRSLAERLQWNTGLDVKEADEGDILQPGHIYVAPGDFHLKVKKRGDTFLLTLNQEEKVNSVRPSVDVVAKSVASVIGKRVIGVLLTGMGKDGAEGMRAIKEAGGHVIVEDESTALVNGMPKALFKRCGCERSVHGC